MYHITPVILCCCANKERDLYLFLYYIENTGNLKYLESWAVDMFSAVSCIASKIYFIFDFYILNIEVDNVHCVSIFILCMNYLSRGEFE